MKHIVILCISVIIFANSQELTIEEASKLRSYNHTFLGKIRQQQAMQRVAKIDIKRAYSIAKNICKSDDKYFSKLKIKRNRLYYLLSINSCLVKIDALNGSIMGSE